MWPLGCMFALAFSLTRIFAFGFRNTDSYLQSLQALDKCQLGDIIREKPERLDAPGDEAFGVCDEIVLMLLFPGMSNRESPND